LVVVKSWAEIGAIYLMALVAVAYIAGFLCLVVLGFELV
jgi:hypothetical protein